MNGTFIANQYISGSSNIRTVITYDNGAEWGLLPAPEVTLDGSETNCEVVWRSDHCSVLFYKLFFVASLFPALPYVFNQF